MKLSHHVRSIDNPEWRHSTEECVDGMRIAFGSYLRQIWLSWLKAIFQWRSEVHGLPWYLVFLYLPKLEFSSEGAQYPPSLPCSSKDGWNNMGIDTLPRITSVISLADLFIYYRFYMMGLLVLKEWNIWSTVPSTRKMLSRQSTWISPFRQIDRVRDKYRCHFHIVCCNILLSAYALLRAQSSYQQATAQYLSGGWDKRGSPTPSVTLFSLMLYSSSTLSSWFHSSWPLKGIFGLTVPSMFAKRSSAVTGQMRSGQCSSLNNILELVKSLL